MLAYNKELLQNIAIHKKAKQWYANQLISTEQMAAINLKYSIEYFKPNVFIRIGLFVFTLFLIGTSLGFISLFAIPFLSQVNSFTFFGIFSSVLMLFACLFFLEKFIVWKNWYSNGIDDALLYAAFGFYIALIIFIIESKSSENDFVLMLCAFCLPVLFIAMKRYLDRFMALLFTLAIYTFVFLLVLKLGDIAKMIMPFLLMLLSGSIVFVVNKQVKKESNFHLKSCLRTIKTIALLLLYMAGNYFVIRESSVEFFDLHLNKGEDIPLAFFFYAFTALIPLLYLYRSIIKKDKLVLFVALVLITVAALTFKYYFSLGHPEITLTLAGIILVLLAYTVIRFLKSDKAGLTFKDDPNEDNFMKSNAEALIIAQSFGKQSSGSNDTLGGGGDFGGAGSGGKF